MDESTTLGEDLTKADRETLVAIADLIREQGFSPTWSEVAARRGKTSSHTAAYVAGRLREKGYVQWQRTHRSLRLTNLAERFMQTLSQSDG